MEMITKQRGLLQPKAPLPPMTIPPLFRVRIKEEIEYHTDDEASEISTRPTTQLQQHELADGSHGKAGDGLVADASKENARTDISPQSNESGVQNQAGATLEQRPITPKSNSSPSTQHFQPTATLAPDTPTSTNALAVEPKTSAERISTERVSTLDSTTGHALKLQPPQPQHPKVTFSKHPPTVRKLAPITEVGRSADSNQGAGFGGPEPLPLAEVRKTQRRVAALLQQKPTGIVQPKHRSPRRRRHGKPRTFHFCMCSRMDPDGLFRDPALNFLREGLKNVGHDFPEFTYTQRRDWRGERGPTTARSMDDGLLPRSPLLTPHRDPYTGRHSTKPMLSPSDITDFDYRKLKSLVLARGGLPKISLNQKVTNPANAFSGAREGENLHGDNASRVPGNTPASTANSRRGSINADGSNSSRHPRLMTTSRGNVGLESNGGLRNSAKMSIDPTAITENTESGNRKLRRTRSKTEDPSSDSKTLESQQKSQQKSHVNGLRPEANFKPRPFDGAVPTKPSGMAARKSMDGLGQGKSGPFAGAIRTKPFEGAMQTKPVATKSQTMLSSGDNGQQPSGYDTEGTSLEPTGPRLRKEGSSFLRSGVTLPRDLSIVGTGSREPTMHNDMTYIRTEATRSTTPPFSDDSYSFVRGREDTYDSFMMPSYAPSAEDTGIFDPTSPGADSNDEDDPRAILQHQYREPTRSSIDVFEKMEDLDYKFDTGTFDFSSDLNVNDVDTTLRLPKDPSAAPSELPTIPETPKIEIKHRRWGSDNRPIFPGGVREAYIKALAVAAARYRMPSEAWMFGQNISRAFVFSYFDHVPKVCPDCEKPVLGMEGEDEGGAGAGGGGVGPSPSRSPRKPAPPLKIKKEMKHIFKDVEVDDYYPGGKRNPLPRMDWHGHRKAKKK